MTTKSGPRAAAEPGSHPASAPVVPQVEAHCSGVPRIHAKGLVQRAPVHVGGVIAEDARLVENRFDPDGNSVDGASLPDDLQDDLVPHGSTEAPRGDIRDQDAGSVFHIARIPRDELHLADLGAFAGPVAANDPPDAKRLPVEKRLSVYAAHIAEMRPVGNDRRMDAGPGNGILDCRLLPSRSEVHVVLGPDDDMAAVESGAPGIDLVGKPSHETLHGTDEEEPRAHGKPEEQKAPAVSREVAKRDAKRGKSHHEAWIARTGWIRSASLTG